MNKIVFFEDIEQFAQISEKRINKLLKNKGSVILFKPEALEEKATYLSSIEKQFTKKEFKDVLLIVTDVNLAELEFFKGLSADVIIELGKRLSIPVCIYSRIQDEELNTLSKWIDGRIILKNSPDNIPIFDEISSIYSGFETLYRLCKKILKGKLDKSIPKITAELLNKPQYEDRFASYASGYQAFYNIVNSDIRESIESPKKLSYIIGTWLLTSILKFPGILVNEIAAASYLNISVEDFKNVKVRNLFKKAYYQGPFSTLEPYWWRDGLDNILIDNNVDEGVGLVEKKIKLKVNPCLCSVDNTSRAGYYCVKSNKPVSRENSKGEFMWIPRGADLTRISQTQLDQLGPWERTLS
jgi:hypothetical protein